MFVSHKGEKDAEEKRRKTWLESYDREALLSCSSHTIHWWCRRCQSEFAEDSPNQCKVGNS